MSTIDEAVVEQAALQWLSDCGWSRVHGPDIAPDTQTAERREYGEVVLQERMQAALARLNPDLPGDALDKAATTICPPPSTIEKLGRLISPIVERRIKTDLDNRVLGSLRDLLLPKLVCGEIRVDASAQEDSETS